LERRSDGNLLLRAGMPLAKYPRHIGEHLLRWAREAPRRPFLLERTGGGEWAGVTYGEAHGEVLRVARWLLGQGWGPQRTVAILSENSVAHAILALAAMHVGLPVVPISLAYSLQSKDFSKLRSIIQRTQPAVIFAEEPQRFGAALQAIQSLHDAVLLVHSRDAATVSNGFGVENRAAVVRFDSLKEEVPVATVEDAFSRLTEEAIAKVLFTSGSTGEPKGVINTQRMLSANQQALAQLWPFVEKVAPVIVDWLPWNHTFGANHNFNLVLRNGGTLYIDGGRPTPTQFHLTVSNLCEIAPTVYFNVPRGFEMLLEQLQANAKLRRKFFSRLHLMFCAAAAMPRHLWEALRSLTQKELGHSLPLAAAWGTTETAPLATSCYFESDGPGNIGIPVPGCELKLLPTGDKYEVRVRGPLVTPGYWGIAERSAEHFDEEGFYKPGDAVRFHDDNAPERGLIFDGRIAEDFKLSTGTWVRVGSLRLRFITALSPIAQDVVVTGHDRDYLGLLIFPNLARCRELASALPKEAAPAQVLADSAVRQRVLQMLQELRKEWPASSMHAESALLLEEPPSIDAGEITDKGYINQKAVLTRRAELVERLYEAKHPAVLRVG
jgi:feruloyl-CoA synthase